MTTTRIIMTFIEFMEANSIQTIWIATSGSPTGIELTHNVDTDCDEDYCDLGELLNEDQFEFLNNLNGEVVNGQWCWDGEGEPRYMSNSIKNIKADA